MTNLSSLSKATLLQITGVALIVIAGGLWTVDGKSVSPFAVMAFAVAAVLGATYFVRSANKSIVDLADICDRAAKGDFEARVLHTGLGGDLARVGNAINNLLDISDAFVREAGASMNYVSRGKYFRKILTRGLPGAFRNSAGIVNAATDAMQHKVQEFTSFSGAIAASVETAIKSITSTNLQLDGNARSLESMARSAEDQSEAVAEHSHGVSANVQTVAAATEQLSAAISEISRQVTRSSEVAGEAVQQADRSSGAIDGLAAAVGKIGEVINLINDIANQTNLLALNATIEAARAGEMGRGFAVVANEVKGLAVQTAKATGDVTAQIHAIQAATTEAVGSIAAVSKTITIVKEIATSIAGAVEQQAAATQEIARNVQQAAAGTAEVSSNMADITQAAQKTGRTAQDIGFASTGLSKESEALQGEVRRFLAGIKAA